MTRVFIKRGKWHVKTETQTESHVTMEAQIRVMWLLAKECHPPPEARERQRRSLPKISDRVSPCQHLDFELLISRTLRE